jgi:hypothetical protein
MNGKIYSILIGQLIMQFYKLLQNSFTLSLLFSLFAVFTFLYKRDGFLSLLVSKNDMITRRR